jgi:hypothetical protein
MRASFEELREDAAALGVNLLHAYLRAGVADSTYYRHRDGRNGMNVSTYNALRQAIATLAGQQEAA